MMTATEAGLKAIELAQAQGLPPEQAANFQWPRCLICGRRPTMLKKPGSWLRFRTGMSGPEFLDVPRYEILPCCSGRYLKEMGPGKKLRLRLAEQVKRRKDGQATVA